MTWIKSQLLRPDGTPFSGCCVTATVVTRPRWLEDASGRVTATASTNTDTNGLWRLDLLPTAEYEVPAAYRIVETCTDEVWYIEVPTSTVPGEEFWMRDVLVPPPDNSSSQQWRPINRLAQLADVDRDSLAAAQPGDFLVMLPSGKWGASRGVFPLTIDWQPHPDNLFAISATVSGFGGAGARLEWGDGTSDTVVDHNPVAHVYATTGVYTLTAIDIAWPAFRGDAKVTIKDHEADSLAFADADDDWRTLLWLNEPADDTVYRIDWGDGSPTEDIGGQQRVPPIPRVPHLYTAAGLYTITITDLSTRRTVTEEFMAGEIGQIWTFPVNPLRPRIDALWLRVGAHYEFFNLTTAQVESAGTVAPHARLTGISPVDREPGAYSIEIRESVDDEVRRQSRRTVVVPNQWDHRLGIDLTWVPTPGVAGSQDITITANDARAECLVDWGDGSPQETVAIATPITHTYDLTELPAAGWLMQVSEIGLPDPRVWSRSVAAPRTVAQPLLNARALGAVDMDVLGVDGDTNNDWYRIDWGDGSSPNPVGAVGRWYPAHHIYNASGVYTITLDGPGVLEPIERTIDVVHYPAPSLSVVEAVDGNGSPIDPSRRTVEVTVNNSESGGPCLVDLGDQSAIRECDEFEIFTHRYEPPPEPVPPGWEIYYVIAMSQADLTAKDQQSVNVPFGTARTLFFTVTPYSGDPSGYTAQLTITDQNPAKTVSVDWGDGFSDEVPVSPIEHEYLDDGPKTLVVRYTDNSETHNYDLVVPLSDLAEGSES